MLREDGVFYFSLIKHSIYQDTKEEMYNSLIGSIVYVNSLII